jgi:hypothetical protein
MSLLRRLDRVTILLLLAATLVLRLAIPSGFMPVADQAGIRVEICTGAGKTFVEIEPGADRQETPRDPCPYGVAAGSALDLPRLPALADARFAVGASTLPGLAPARLAARRALRPPARGPPAFA